MLDQTTRNDYFILIRKGITSWIVGKNSFAGWKWTTWLP